MEYKPNPLHLKPYIHYQGKNPFPTYGKLETASIFMRFNPILDSIYKCEANPLAVLHVLQYVLEIAKKAAEKHFADQEEYDRFIEHITNDSKSVVGAYIGT